MKNNRILKNSMVILFSTAILFTCKITFSNQLNTACQPLYKKGVMSLNFNPAFLHIDEYNDDGKSSDGLTISSFFNAYIASDGTPPLGFFERDLVARITDLGELDYDSFDPSSDVEILTDLAPGMPKTVWPNEALRAPDGIFSFEAIVIPQGFHSAGFPGRLSVINLEDSARQEYLIDQSTQNNATGFTYPGDPANSPRFYHRVLFIDMNGDGLQDLVTVRSGFRVVPSIYPPYSELVYFKNPGAALDPNVQWEEVVLHGGPAAGYMGPDFSLSAYDFEGDGVPEIVATHLFSSGDLTQTNGKITIYGAPEGGTWADVNATFFMLPRMKDIKADQGLPFDVLVTDLNMDGKVDILATNHQPDNCSPITTSIVPGRVYAFEQPSSGNIFTDDWDMHILIDDILPNPSLAPIKPPGRMAPGHAQPFYPVRCFERLTKPWILVSGDESGKVWVLLPEKLYDSENWNYTSSVIFDLNNYYGAGTTQTPMIDPFGITISTIGAPAVRYDHPGPFGIAEIFIPAFEAKDIHVFTYRKIRRVSPIQCPEDKKVECSAK